MLVVVLLIYVCCLGLLWWAMRQPETFGRIMSKIPGPLPFLLFPFARGPGPADWEVAQQNRHTGHFSVAPQKSECQPRDMVSESNPVACVVSGWPDCLTVPMAVSFESSQAWLAFWFLHDFDLRQERR